MSRSMYQNAANCMTIRFRYIAGIPTAHAHVLTRDPLTTRHGQAGCVRECNRSSVGKGSGHAGGRQSPGGNGTFSPLGMHSGRRHSYFSCYGNNIYERVEIGGYTIQQ